MKPSHPMAQFKQWQKTNELKIEPVKQSKFGSVKNPQSESHSEPKKKYQETITQSVCVQTDAIHASIYADSRE